MLRTAIAILAAWESSVVLLLLLLLILAGEEDGVVDSGEKEDDGDIGDPENVKVSSSDWSVDDGADADNVNVEGDKTKVVVISSIDRVFNSRGANGKVLPRVVKTAAELNDIIVKEGEAVANIIFGESARNVSEQSTAPPGLLLQHAHNPEVEL